MPSRGMRDIVLPKGRTKRYHKRSPRACDECKLRKKKCDGNQPCRTCTLCEKGKSIISTLGDAPFDQGFWHRMYVRVEDKAFTTSNPKGSRARRGHSVRARSFERTEVRSLWQQPHGGAANAGHAQASSRGAITDPLIAKIRYYGSN